MVGWLFFWAEEYVARVWRIPVGGKRTALWRRLSFDNRKSLGSSLLLLQVSNAVKQKVLTAWESSAVGK